MDIKQTEEKPDSKGNKKTKWKTTDEEIMGRRKQKIYNTVENTITVRLRHSGGKAT